MKGNQRVTKFGLAGVLAGPLVVLSAVALWLYGYRCASPTYADEYLERFGIIALVTLASAVPCYAAWRWLMRGTRPPSAVARTAGLAGAYIDAWRHACDFRSNVVHPRFASLFLVFELTLVANFFPWLFLMDWLRHLFGTSEAAMYLPALMIASVDVLPFPAMLARRFRLAGRSVWWTLPTLLFAQFLSYVILAWLFGYAWATCGK